MKQARECPRQFFFEQILGAKRNGRWSKALSQGKVIHKILELTLRGHSFQGAMDLARVGILQPLLVQLKSSADRVGLLPSGKLLPEEEEKAQDAFYMAASTACYARLPRRGRHSVSRPPPNNWPSTKLSRSSIEQQ